MIPDAFAAAGDDPARRAAVAFRAALIYLSQEDPLAAADVVTQALGNPGTPDALRGALLCVAAVARQRRGAALAEVLAPLEEAGDLAAARDACWHTEFGAANIAAHRISVLVAAGHPKRARAVWDATDLSALSAERQARVADELGLA